MPLADPPFQDSIDHSLLVTLATLPLLHSVSIVIFDGDLHEQHIKTSTNVISHFPLHSDKATRKAMDA